MLDNLCCCCCSFARFHFWSNKQTNFDENLSGIGKLWKIDSFKTKKMWRINEFYSIHKYSSLGLIFREMHLTWKKPHTVFGPKTFPIGFDCVCVYTSISWFFFVYTIFSWNSDFSTEEMTGTKIINHNENCLHFHLLVLFLVVVIHGIRKIYNICV